MSVIGRLDDQVNEIIIKPVNSRQRPESEDSTTPLQEGAQPSARTAKENQTHDERAKPNAQPELPVWLL
jgi:hypothetical protein